MAACARDEESLLPPPLLLALEVEKCLVDGDTESPDCDDDEEEADETLLRTTNEGTEDIEKDLQREPTFRGRQLVSLERTLPFLVLAVLPSVGPVLVAAVAKAGVADILIADKTEKG